MVTDMPDHLWSASTAAAPLDPALVAISSSLTQDMPLADADLRASAAYARGLVGCGILSQSQGQELAETLLHLRQELRTGTWQPSDVAEDIHTAIELEVTHRLGDLGARLHTGRSRNDQVATAFRLTLMEQIDALVDDILVLQHTVQQQAHLHLDTLMPGYTHLQRAQPIRLSHWLLAHFWPLSRDVERLVQARARVAVLPLGSGALSGHPFGLDRQALAKALGFEGISENSLDAVGERDFVVEPVFACSLLHVHLSRLAEELVLWSSAEFGFVRWPQTLATGSSLMPQKKNPDLPELVRGRTAGVCGDLMTLMMLLKGLPSSYQRDLQEDKAPAWHALTTTGASVRAMAAALGGLEFIPDNMQQALSDDVLATEVADLLVERGIAFRDAYRRVSLWATESRQSHRSLKEVVQQCSEQELAPLDAKAVEQLSVESCVERRQAHGGTSRNALLQQLSQAKQWLEQYDIGSKTEEGN